MRRPRQSILVALVLAVMAAASGLTSTGILEIEGTIRLHIKPGPTAAIKAGPPGGPYISGPFHLTAPATAEFVVCCAQDPTGGVLSFEWDFDYDGVDFNTQATGKGPHLQEYHGPVIDRLIALKIISTSGVELIITQILNVETASVKPLEADAGGPYEGEAGSPVTFTGAVKHPEAIDESKDVVFAWDFDYDGSFTPATSGVDLTQPTHTYAEAGAYTVALRITNGDEVSPVATATVTIDGVVEPDPDSDPEELVATAVADTYVSETNKNANFGLEDFILVQARNSHNHRALVRFDLAGIPEGAAIQSATLRLFASDIPSQTRTYQVQRATADWTETGVSWNNQPSVTSTVVSEADTPGSAGWMEWDVSADVQAIVNGFAANYGWRVRDVSEGGPDYRTTQFVTRESGNSSLHPVLVIIYEMPE